MKLASDLPEVVPVFPLAGTLLLPRAMLPLHIFEPRYRAMVRDSLRGDGLIGMIQPLRGGDDINPPVFDIGCLGKIVGSKSLDDGRYLISLQGVSRVPCVRGTGAARGRLPPHAGPTMRISGGISTAGAATR